MIVRSKNANGRGHSYETIDFRETMPAAGNETMYVDKEDASTVGGLAVGVPGELRGWEKLHSRHGRLSWKDIFAPAIKIARGGFTVNVDLAGAIEDSADFILADPLWSETYAPDGEILKLGDTCYRKRYADTLEKIANEGPQVFYGPKSRMAVNTAAAVKSSGGILTTADLANYSAIVREPVNITYRGHRIFSTVAPSSGAVVLSALKVFEGFRGNYTDDEAGVNVTTHRLIEATRFAYGQRTSYGDPNPAFGFANITALQMYYLKEDVVEDIRAKIVDNTTFPLDFYDPNKYITLNDSGTSHLAVIDGDQNAVSLTTTVNLVFGSQADGIILNNEMDDFSTPGTVNAFGFAASPVNYILPGKRPQSSIASSIAEDLATGVVQVATGSAGGSRIITATLQNLHHTLDQGSSANASAHHARWHDQLSGQTYFEWASPERGLSGYDNRTVEFLGGLGYNVTWEAGGATSHVIRRHSNGKIEGASDPRRPAGRAAAF